MRRSVFALLLIALTAAGCGVRPSGVIPGGPAPSGPANGAVLYFVSNGQPVRVLRPLSSDVEPAGAIALLGDGPDENERELGYTTEVPPGTTVLGQTPEPPESPGSPGRLGPLQLTLSVDVNALSGPAVAQIVCTVRDSTSSRGQVTLKGQGRERGPLSCPLPG